MRASAPFVASLCGLLAVAPASADAGPEIPEQAPTEEVRVFCGTGRLGPTDYQQLWSAWRQTALAARAAEDSLCEAFALSQLARVAQRRYFAQTQLDYVLRAQHLLSKQLRARDPRWIELYTQWASLADTEQRPELYETLIELLEQAQEDGMSESPWSCEHPEADPPRPYARWNGVDYQLMRAWTELGASHTALDAPEQAQRAFSKVLDMAEHLAESQSAEGPSHGLATAIDRSLGLLAQLADAHPYTLDVAPLERGVRLMKRFAPKLVVANALESLAKVYRLKGEAEAQELALRQAVQALEAEAPASRILATDRLADFLESQGRVDESAALYNELLDAVLESENAHATRSIRMSLDGFYLRQRRWSELRQSLESQLVDEPDHWYVLRSLGQLEAQEGRWIRATDLLKQSLKSLDAAALDPDNTNISTVLMELGLAFRRSDREEAARRAFARAYDIELRAFHNKEDAGRTMEPWMFAGPLRAAIGMGDLQTAEHWRTEMNRGLEQAGNKDAEAARYHRQLARLYHAQDRLDDAARALERTVELQRTVHPANSQRLAYSLMHAARLCLELDLELDCWSL